MSAFYRRRGGSRRPNRPLHPHAAPGTIQPGRAAMNPDFQPLFDSLKERISARGVEVRERCMDKEKPGEFDGPSITLNPGYDLEARCYFLAHSFGSIVLWATDFDGSKKLFDELRSA